MLHLRPPLAERPDLLLHAAAVVRHPLPLGLDPVVGDLELALRFLEVPEGASHFIILFRELLEFLVLLLALDVELQEGLHAEDVLDVLYRLVCDVFFMLRLP